MHDLSKLWKKVCGPLYGKFASPFGMPPRRAPIRLDHRRAWGEEGVAASEGDRELAHRRVFQVSTPASRLSAIPHFRARGRAPALTRPRPPRG